MTDWEKHFRQRRRLNTDPDYGPVSFGAILLTDNLNAVNQYMHSTPVKTAQAAALLSDWARWWITTGDPSNYIFSIPDAVWDEARNRRLAFNLANATTQAEIDQVHAVATEGVSSEQAAGQQDRRDPNTGLIFVPPPSGLPTWAKTLAIGAVAGLILPRVIRVLLPI